MIPELRCYVQQYSIQIPILSLPPQDIDTTIGIQTELNPTTYSANTRIINHISPIHHIHEAKLTLTGPS